MAQGFTRFRKLQVGIQSVIKELQEGAANANEA